MASFSRQVSPPLHLENCPKTGQWPWKSDGDGPMAMAPSPVDYGTLWHRPWTDPKIFPCNKAGPRTSFDLRTRSNKRPGQQRRDLEKQGSRKGINPDNCKLWDIMRLSGIFLHRHPEGPAKAEGKLVTIRIDVVYLWRKNVGHISLDTRHDRFSNNSAMPHRFFLHWNRGMQDVRNPPLKSWFVTIWRRENP